LVPLSVSSDPSLVSALSSLPSVASVASLEVTEVVAVVVEVLPSESLTVTVVVFEVVKVS